MTTTEATATHTPMPNTKPDTFGCVSAQCSCGWVSESTNRPQHLSRAFRSHREGR